MVVSLQHGYPGEAADSSINEVPKAISKEPTDYGNQINCTESDNEDHEHCEADCQQVDQSKSWSGKEPGQSDSQQVDQSQD
ncbi:MAG: hypothetical protein HQ518_19300, partial [Rhodopirellula sp.]|nr:hypothetical protein [Rhodopirellula sp.]